GVAPNDIALFPGHTEFFGDDTVNINNGFCAEIADAGLNDDAAVGLDEEQPVVTNGSGEKAAGRNADSANFAPTAFRLGPTLLPAKLLSARIEGFFQEGAGRMHALAFALGAPGRFALGTICLANVNLIKRELARRLRQQRLHHD